MRHLFSGRRDSGLPTSCDRPAPRHVGRRLGRVDRGLPIREIAILAAALVFATAVAPAAALASSLLSGYGGPGEGSEAILGSTLINGPSGGAGGGSSGGAGAAPAGTGTSPVPGTAISGTAGSGRGRGALSDGRTGLSSSGSTSAGGARGRAGHANGAGSGAPATRAGSPGTALAAQAADRGAVESEALGLTAQDLIYVLLVLAALAAVWALTVRLARTGAGEALSGAKGTAQGTRLKP